MNQLTAPTEVGVHRRRPERPFCGRFSPQSGALPPLGFSGCDVRLGRWGEGLCVEKRAGAPYAARLERQIARQARARQTNALSFVRIPEIYGTQWTRGGGFAVRMEYLLFHDCLRAFETASRSQIDHMARLLISYVEANIAASPLRAVPPACFRDKLEQIEAALARIGQEAVYRDLIRSVRARLPTRQIKLPIGRAHGDLTLSNVMVASDGSEIGLLDFLDGYLESPIIDIAKLRQDTCFHWSLQIAEGPVDRARMVPVLRYMDSLLLAYFGRYEWVRRHLDLIQAINLLRIAPYVGTSQGARSGRVREFLLRAIGSLSS